MTEHDEPRYECDLIMKGGITSGIVYPPAIAEIARDHRLRSIGGSSAGAIAAVAAAAAELGRTSTNGGFAALARLPVEMSVADGAGRTGLRRLFQAQPATAETFDLLWAVRSTSGVKRIVTVCSMLVAIGTRRALAMLAGAIAITGAVFLLAAAIVEGAWYHTVAGVLLVLCVIGLWLISLLVVGARLLMREAPAAVAANQHGLCNGRTVDGATHPGLTDWLHGQIETLAGRRDGSGGPATSTRPVTYGDLKTAGVNLVTMTTNLTQGSSEVFPFNSDRWAFDPDELRRLFPDDVVDHLVTAGSSIDVSEEDRREALDAHGLVPLPPTDDLPILLGARLSLSFPILLSAVPLHSFLPVRTGDTWTMQYVRCWLSDGGITSNLPIHLFDSPLPTRPTYGINLGGGGDRSRPPSSNVWRPLKTNTGFSPGRQDITSPLDLLAAVFDTMQNWSDNSLRLATGYRDRICTIALDEGEGGMNLDMDTDTMLGMIPRGTVAGANLAWIQRSEPGAYEPPEGIPDEISEHQWDRHRFIRYRGFLSGLGRYLTAARAGFETGEYAKIGAAPKRTTWLPYRDDWTPQRNSAVAASLGRFFSVDQARLSRGGPRGVSLGVSTRSQGLLEKTDAVEETHTS